MDIKNFSPRSYQSAIVETCVKKNTLVVLPTGLGKTKIAILTALARLRDQSDAKVFVLTPTRPLANQIRNEFLECTTLTQDEVVLCTGTLAPEKRLALYKNTRVIVATPQTIQEDLENKRVSLADCRLLIIDEAHRSREHFANTIVAQFYAQQGVEKRILALTASPGSTKEKIDEICKNLFIEAVEIHGEQDVGVKEFVQEKKIEYVNLDFPDALKEIHRMVKEVYLDKIVLLRSFGFTKPASYVNKRDLIVLQARLRNEVYKNKAAFYGISVVAQVLKLSFAMEMLETQSVHAFLAFLEKLKSEQTKAAQVILHEQNVQQAIEKAKTLEEAGQEHPKFLQLGALVEKQIKERADMRIIVFASYRNTVDCIMDMLAKRGIKAGKLVGQKEGQSQKEQIQMIQDFGAGMFNCLVTTNIGEEGLSIAGADTAIFYDNTASSIRKIQRAGRVGRLKEGRIIFMITKGTRDAAYYWKSKKDEARMKTILYKMQGKPEGGQSHLDRF